jgi:lysozyme
MRSRKRIWRILIAAAAMAAALGFSGAWWFRHYQPDRTRYPLRGIDVSHHQGPIDWQAVARDDVTFAYLKATEGADHQDTLFAENWRAARKAGLAVGAYHYFTLCRSGAAQAANYLRTVPQAKDALPAAVDLEFGGNCGERPSGAAVRRNLDAFLRAVEARDGRPAVLYLTPEFFSVYGANMPKRDLWRRSVFRRPGADAQWTLWQYHNRGKVAGVSGPVDLNVFAADRPAFDRFAGRPGGRP